MSTSRVPSVEGAPQSIPETPKTRKPTARKSTCNISHFCSTGTACPADMSTNLVPSGEGAPQSRTKKPTARKSTCCLSHFWSTFTPYPSATNPRPTSPVEEDIIIDLTEDDEIVDLTLDED